MTLEYYFPAPLRQISSSNLICITSPQRNSVHTTWFMKKVVPLAWILAHTKTQVQCVRITKWMAVFVHLVSAPSTSTCFLYHSTHCMTSNYLCIQCYTLLIFICIIGTVFDDISMGGCIVQSKCQCKHDKVYNTGEVYRKTEEEWCVKV